jgi:hypothetical protein
MGHHAPTLLATAAILLPAASLALTATPAVEAAYKSYKETGVVSNDLISESAARLTSLNFDCKKDLNEMALASLTEEHRKELGGGKFVDGLPIAQEIKAITNLVRMFTRGMTDLQQANFGMEAGRGAAIKYRSERCIPPKESSATGLVNTTATPSTERAETQTAATTTSSSSATTPSSVTFRKVDGIEDWDGEIVGHPAEGSAFQRIKIGMTMVQVIAELGPPSSQTFSSTALTDAAWLKVGPGRYESEHMYNGIGRLSYSTEASFGLGEMRLVRITHRREEGTTTEPTAVTDDQIAAYESVVEQKCSARGRQQGESVSVTEKYCICMAKTLKDGFKKSDWQLATFFFLQGRAREEAKVVASQDQNLKVCKRGAP